MSRLWHESAPQPTTNGTTRTAVKKVGRTALTRLEKTQATSMRMNTTLRIARASIRTPHIALSVEPRSMTPRTYVRSALLGLMARRAGDRHRDDGRPCAKQWFGFSSRRCLRARESSAWFSCCEFREFVDSIQLRGRPSKLVSSLAAALWQFDGERKKARTCGPSNLMCGEAFDFTGLYAGRTTYLVPYISCHISRAIYLVPCITCHVSGVTYLAPGISRHERHTTRHTTRHATSSARARHC